MFFELECILLWKFAYFFIVDQHRIVFYEELKCHGRIVIRLEC